MRLFEINDHYTGSFSLMDANPLIEAKSNIDALKKYLKAKNIDVRVERSADNFVQFGVVPMIRYNDRLYVDGSKRASWYKVVE